MSLELLSTDHTPAPNTSNTSPVGDARNNHELLYGLLEKVTQKQTAKKLRHGSRLAAFSTILPNHLM